MRPLRLFARLAGRRPDGGVELTPRPARHAAATAIWLFDSTAKSLPGGYDPGELSPNSPVSPVAAFPQELVYVGRATVLIRGLTAALNEEWNLAKEWMPSASLAASTTPPRVKRRARELLRQALDRVVWFCFRFVRTLLRFQMRV